MHVLIYSDLVLKQLKKLDGENKKRIISVLERTRIRPHLHIKKLIGNPYFSLRAGKYRIILDVQKDNLVIYVIGLGLRKKFIKSN